MKSTYMRYWIFVIDQYVSVCIYGHVTNCEFKKKMLLEFDWFVLTDTIKRGHSRLWQQTQQHSFGKIKEKKKVCRLYIIHFDFIKEKFNTCLHNSVHEISCFVNLETKMANRSRFFDLFIKMSRSQKRVVSSSSSSPQTIVTNVAPIVVRKIYD